MRIRGGPDEYTLQNLSNRRLLDVAVIAPSDRGFRVGWLDELPSADAEKKELEKEKEKEKEKEANKKKPADPKKKAAELKEKADELFRDAEAKPKEKEAELPPLPAEGDATVRARVDQLLNQVVNVTVEQAPGGRCSARSPARPGSGTRSTIARWPRSRSTSASR